MPVTVGAGAAVGAAWPRGHRCNCAASGMSASNVEFGGGERGGWVGACVAGALKGARAGAEEQEGEKSAEHKQ
eukprot:6010822-Pleurochrysis_carterae.AAC.1